MTNSRRCNTLDRSDQSLPPELRFIDLFAGIGGMRLAFEKAGGSCVFSSEWDKFAKQTYEANHSGELFGDIRKINAADIESHDILVAGFPCQPFSLAGVSKNNALGREHGFAHATQGTLFFDIVRILDYHKPKAFLLENVKNLRSHDGGNTFKEILRTLEEDLGYNVHSKVIDARAVVPQHRERTYIVGFREPTRFEFPEVSLNGSRPTFRSILQSEPDPKYTLSAHLWQYLQEYAAKHKAKGNGFGFGLVDPNDPDVTTRTLSARYHKDGSEILIDTGGDRPRRLTPRECARLMGFPESFDIRAVSDTQAYRQFGNSVVVPVVELIAESITSHLRQQ
jgi:DNA (cytosine-5)-methyltransferase 1